MLSLHTIKLLLDDTLSKVLFTKPKTNQITRGHNNKEIFQRKELEGTQSTKD